MQSQKTRDQRITVCNYDDSVEHDNIYEPVPLYITPRDQELEKVLFTIWGDKSL